MESNGEMLKIFKRKSDNLTMDDYNNNIHSSSNGSMRPYLDGGGGGGGGGKDINSDVSSHSSNNNRNNNLSLYNLNDMINSYNHQLHKKPSNQEIFQSEQQSHPLTSHNKNSNAFGSNEKMSYSELQHFHHQILMAQQQHQQQQQQHHQNRYFDSNNNDIESIDQYKKLKQFQPSPPSNSSLSNVSTSESSNSPSSPQNINQKSSPNSFNFASHNGYPPHLPYYQNPMKLHPASGVAGSPLFAAAAAAAAQNNPAAMFMNPFSYYPSDPSSIFMMNRKDSNSSMLYHQHINGHSNTAVNKRPKSTFPFGKCKVCNDKATGIHYGIATCEGCKGFFKRSTLRKEKYRCFFGNCCPLSPENRNRCKSCRFRKCLEVGMSIQGVKMGRIPKAEKEKALMYLKKKNSALDGTGVNDKENNMMNHLMMENVEDQSDSSSNNENNNYDYDESDEVLSEGGDGNNSNNTASFEEFYSQYHEKSAPSSSVPNNFSHPALHQNPITANRYHVRDEKPNEYYENNKRFFLQNLQKNLPVDVSDHLNKTLTPNYKENSNNANNQEDDDREVNEIIVIDDERRNEDCKKKSESINFNLSLKSEETKLSQDKKDNIEESKRDKLNPNKNELSSPSTINNDESLNSSITHQIMKYSCKSLEENMKVDDRYQFYNLNLNRKDDNGGICSLIELLKMHKTFENSNLTINRYHSSSFSPNPQLDYSYYIILSLISDKIYQAHIENNDKIACLYERAIRLIKDNVKIFDGHDVSLHEVWNSLLESIPQIVKNFISFAKEVPGLNELSSKDFTTIVNNRLFDYFIIKHSPLFIEGESYMMLPNNIQYSRQWMNRVVGEEMTNALFEFSEEFNSLNMTTKETALLVPFVLTVPDTGFDDQAIIANLHEYYYRAILYEFDLNRRTDVFISKWKKLLDKMPELNELQIRKIGSLTPK